MIEELAKILIVWQNSGFPKRNLFFVNKIALPSGFTIKNVIKNHIPSIISWQIYLRRSLEISDR